MPVSVPRCLLQNAARCLRRNKASNRAYGNVETLRRRTLHIMSKGLAQGLHVYGIPNLQKPTATGRKRGESTARLRQQSKRKLGQNPRQ